MIQSDERAPLSLNGYVEALDPVFADAAKALSETLGLLSAGEPEFVLQLGAAGLRIQTLGPHAPGPLMVDFLHGGVAHRRLQGGGNGQMIAKAVGIQPGIRPYVLDATAGLGRDAFVLAQLGCCVTLLERNPVIAALLSDGLQRAKQDAEVAPIIERMRFRPGDALAVMRAWEGEPPQVIYLDPMFPHRDKSALVKKEMSMLRPVVGDDMDAAGLVEAALNLATHRVVVKRPRKAPNLSDAKVGYVLEGKSSRFDIYPKQAFKR